MTYSILISKANTVLNVDFDSMPEAAKRFLIEYGLKQKLNDAGASAIAKDLGVEEAGKQALAAAENMIAALMAGNISVRAAGKSLSLEQKVEQRVIRAVFKAFCKRAVAKEVDQSNEALLNLIAKQVGKPADAIRKAMQSRIDAEVIIEKSTPALPEVDLSSL